MRFRRGVVGILAALLAACSPQSPPPLEPPWQLSSARLIAQTNVGALEDFKGGCGLAVYEISAGDVAAIEREMEAETSPSDINSGEFGWSLSSAHPEFRLCGSRPEAANDALFAELADALANPDALMNSRRTDWNDAPAMFSGPYLSVRYVYVINQRRSRLYALQEWNPPY